MCFQDHLVCRVSLLNEQSLVGMKRQLYIEKVKGVGMREPRATPPLGGPENVRQARQSLAIVTLVGIVLGLVFFFFDPAGGGLFWRCPFNWMTGWYCPGCGGQRALHSLLHGNIRAALRANGLAVLIFAPAVFYAYLRLMLRAFGGTVLPVPRTTAWRIGLFLALIIGYGILRNLPWEHFRLLRP